VIGAEAGALVGGGGVAKVFTVSPSLEFWPTTEWGVAARGFVPLEEPTVSNEKGEASVGVFLGGVGAAFRLRPPPGKWQLLAELGGGGAMLRMKGAPRAGLLGTRDVATSPTAYACLGFGYEVAPEVAVTASAFGGVLFPRITIQFANEPVAHWGPLYGGGAVGAALRFR
jgi:hypothetical protein